MYTDYIIKFLKAKGNIDEYVPSNDKKKIINYANELLKKHENDDFVIEKLLDNKYLNKYLYQILIISLKKDLDDDDIELLLSLKSHENGLVQYEIALHYMAIKEEDHVIVNKFVDSDLYGYPRASFMLGIIFQNGFYGYDKNFEDAYNFYNKAIERGCIDASAKLYTLVNTRFADNPNRVKHAKEMLLNAYNLGSHDAMKRMALEYKLGHVEGKDENDALKIYYEISKTPSFIDSNGAGSTFIYEILGKAYQDCSEVLPKPKKSYEYEAAKYFQQGAYAKETNCIYQYVRYVNKLVIKPGSIKEVRELLNELINKFDSDEARELLIEYKILEYEIFPEYEIFEYEIFSE